MITHKSHPTIINPTVNSLILQAQRGKIAKLEERIQALEEILQNLRMQEILDGGGNADSATTSTAQN